MKKNIFFIILIILFSLFCYFTFVFYTFNLFNYSVFIEWEFFSLNGQSLVMSLIFDWISIIFLITVTLISRIIILYSVYYMAHDKDYFRFSFIIFMFVISIMFLIIRPNIVSLLLGWDGLGVTSYILVIFYQSERSSNSGIITVLRNRVGDSRILISIALIFYTGSWNFIYFDKVDFSIMLFVVLAAITKSAQVPFSAWLPAAIAAPTPVSALVHSSTLVTAGVFLLIRFHSLLIKNENVMFTVFLLGLFTMFISGWVANFEKDFKKVIALSTLRQLGLMFIVIGAGNSTLAFFHLIMHALFKSTLFISAGFVIHNLNGRQDSRFARLFNFSSPYLRTIFRVMNLSLCGFPFLSGFYSKDGILEYRINKPAGRLILFFVVLATGFTLSYRLRVIYLINFSEGKIRSLYFSSDFNKILFFCTLVLFFLRVSRGFVFVINSIILVRKVNILKSFEKFYILIILFFTVFFMVFYISKLNKIYILKKIFWLRNLIFFLPNLSSYFVSKPFFMLRKNSIKNLEKGWLEQTGPQGLVRGLRTTSWLIKKSLRLFLINQYIFSVIIVVLIVVLFLCFENS